MRSGLTPHAGRQAGRRRHLCLEVAWHGVSETKWEWRVSAHPGLAQDEEAMLEGNWQQRREIGNHRGLNKNVNR